MPAHHQRHRGACENIGRKKRIADLAVLQHAKPQFDRRAIPALAHVGQRGEICDAVSQMDALEEPVAGQQCRLDAQQARALVARRQHVAVRRHPDRHEIEQLFQMAT